MTANEILKLEVYNLALSHLGMGKISSLTGADPSTIACNMYYEPCLNDMFREHEWCFARVQQAMTDYTGDVPLGHTYAYDYPTLNAATVWTVFNEGCADDKHSQDFSSFYVPEENKRIIVTELEDAVMEYTYLVSEISIWDAKFKMALTYRLAASMAKVITGDPDKRGAELGMAYNSIISEAKRIGAIESPKKPKQVSGYQNARG